jgi:hypothetical protein
MKTLSVLGWSLALGLSAVAGQAQETNQLEKFNQQLKQLQENFDKQQREMRENFERMLREQQAQIDALKRQLAAAPTNPPPVAAVQTNVAPTAATPMEVAELKQRVDELTTASKKTFISQFNPGIGFAGDTIFSYTGKGNDVTGNDRFGGFDAFLRTAELNLEASVDPFARAYAVISGSADARTGEASMGVEEASIVTTSLPWNLTVQGGRFFADFGRLAYVHDHDLPFVWRPLVLDRYIGGESKTDGAQVNWLLPTRQYISLTLGLGDQFGDSPNGVGTFRGLNGLNYWGHLSTYFDLSPNLSLETGVSGLINANTQSLGGVDQQSRYIGGTDITLRYQPLDSTIHRGLVWGTEMLYTSGQFGFDPDGLPANGDEFSRRENAFGLYSYLESKLSREFKAGFLFQWVEDPINPLLQTYSYAPYLTYNPSEFQTLRLQYSHVDPRNDLTLKPYNAVYLQWTFIIGRHVHGFKQR